MGFIQTTFLAGLAALAIPVIVHLIFRWQTRRVELGTIRFLAEILRETARRRRVKRWLLLSLRLTAVALLVLLFARPYLLATQQSGNRALRIVLVDRSASMSLPRDGKRLVDHAASRVAQLRTTAGEQTEVAMAVFDSEVQATSGDALEELLAEHSSRATSYGTAMAWARDQCVQSSHLRREIYVLTDLQRSGLDWATPAPFPADVTLHIDDLGREEVNNLAVTNAVPSRMLVRPGESVTIRVTLFNHGPFPITDVPTRLTLRSDHRTQRYQEAVTLPPHEAVELEFEVGTLEAGLWQGAVDLEADDDLTFDNRRHLAILAAPPRRVLVVDGSEPDAILPETFFLEKALRLAPEGETYADSPFTPTTVRLGDGELPLLDQFDLVVLANVGDVRAADAQRLGEFVRAGGGLLVFTGEQATAESTATLVTNGLVPGEIVGIARSNDLPFRWQSWDTTHPLLQTFADPQHGDLQRLGFNAYTQLVPSASANVLARFSPRDPALVTSRIGSGRVLWFLSAAGRQWGDWTRSRLFLPLIHQMLGDLTGLSGGGPVRSAVLDEIHKTDRGIDRPGVFQRDGHWLVVNSSSQESETDRATPAEFARRFQLTLPDEKGTATSIGPTDGSRFDLRADEIWSWVLWPLIAVLCLEFFVANRTTA